MEDSHHHVMSYPFLPITQFPNIGLNPNSSLQSTMMSNPFPYSEFFPSKVEADQHKSNTAGSEGGESSNNMIKSTAGTERETADVMKKSWRRSKYAFHTRSQVDILDDGYRWRKYGQKTVKNSNFPRSYYRCTDPGCNVKKQVQRLTKDEETVVTTYEGVHTHPVDKSTDNFEHILKQMHIYVSP